jgi:uncharacterized membrane protein
VTSLAAVLAPLGAVLNGVAAGIMLSTVVGIVPLMLALPYRRYVAMVQFMWPRYDPLMPILNAGALLLTVAAAALAGAGPARPMLVAGAVLLAAVLTISITKNVPVNRFVGSLDPDRPPTDWHRVDPRARWRAWNLARTVINLLAFATNVTGAVLLH